MHKSDVPNDEIAVAGGCAIVALVLALIAVAIAAAVMGS